MPNQTYYTALGENRWAFADADYAFVFLLMTVDESYQAWVDRPVSPDQLVMSGKLPWHFRDRLARKALPLSLTARAEDLCTSWVTITKRRNNLAHSWGYTTAEGVVQLGGYSHDFSKSEGATHTHMTWSQIDIEQMTADCRGISQRLTQWRLDYEMFQSEQHETGETKN